jgi:hypothetical protein
MKNFFSEINRIGPSAVDLDEISRRDRNVLQKTGAQSFVRRVYKDLGEQVEHMGAEYIVVSAIGPGIRVRTGCNADDFEDVLRVDASDMTDDAYPI